MSTEWRPGVEEALGYYVYLLVDPRDNSVFYVGKGVGRRCFSHLDEAHKTARDTVDNYEKLSTIRDVEDTGLEVHVEILRHGLTEEESFLVESTAIELLGFSDLTNRVVGHGTNEHGRMSTDDINAQYGATPVESDPNHKVILIRVAKGYTKGMDADALYQQTRKWWRAGPRRLDADYAMAVYGGVVRAVYRIDSWEEPSEAVVAEDPRRVGRYAFIGHLDAELDERYRFADVTVEFPQGNQNPFTYVNC